MATSTNGDAAAALDDIKPPQGVILPPKEFRGEWREARDFPGRGYLANTRVPRSNPRKDSRLRREKWSLL